MNKKLTKKTILTGAIIAGVAAIPITGVLAYENLNTKNVETATVAQYLKGNSINSNEKNMNQQEMNDESLEMNGEKPPELPDETMSESTNDQLDNNQGFFEMLKNLPSDFVNWLKNLFDKK